MEQGAQRTIVVGVNLELWTLVGETEWTMDRQLDGVHRVSGCVVTGYDLGSRFVRGVIWDISYPVL